MTTRTYHATPRSRCTSCTETRRVGVPCRRENASGAAHATIPLINVHTLAHLSPVAVPRTLLPLQEGAHKLSKGGTGSAAKRRRSPVERPKTVTENSAEGTPEEAPPPVICPSSGPRAKQSTRPAHLPPCAVCTHGAHRACAARYRNTVARNHGQHSTEVTNRQGHHGVRVSLATCSPNPKHAADSPLHQRRNVDRAPMATTTRLRCIACRETIQIRLQSHPMR